MLGYLIPVILFAAAFYAVNRWAPYQDKRGEATKLRTYLFLGLGALAFLWVLAAVGLLGQGAVSTVKPF